MRVFLNGGGSGEKTISTYKEINKIINHKKPVLYIPLAMDENEHPYDECYEWIKEEISVIDSPGIDMIRSFNELYNTDFNNYSMIFIGGGNTYKLLKGIKDSNCFDKFKDYINSDGIIFGGSAGAVIFGKDINSIKVMDENTVFLEDTKGFDLLNSISIFPHYTNYKSKYTKEENEKLQEKYTNFLTNYSSLEKVIAYPEENTIFVDDNGYKLLGELPYYLFENGMKKKL